MTLDERLLRLAERHEALTQSVEMLRATVHEQSSTVDRILTLIEKDSQNISALARIAEVHERRLTDLEGSSPSEG